MGETQDESGNQDVLAESNAFVHVNDFNLTVTSVDGKCDDFLTIVWTSRRRLTILLAMRKAVQEDSAHRLLPREATWSLPR